MTKYILISLAGALMLSACSRSTPEEVDRSWESCLRELARHDQLPLLDGRNITMYSSYDRSGGNNDFNNFADKGSEAGWVTLLDVRGPGCLRRLWMTGTDPGHPIRIYIDGGKKPVIDSTLDELFGQVAPWTPPIAQYVNMCYYSYVPVTYRKSLRIETREPNVHPFWGARRIFFQAAVETFPEGTRVESYPSLLSKDQLAAAEDVRMVWEKSINQHDIHLPDDANALDIPSGQRRAIFAAEGSGTIDEFSIDVQPADPDGWSRVNREFLLQDAVLRVYYDGQATPGIEVPLGDFFANAWRKRAYGAWWFTSGDEGFTCRLPMPYAQRIRLEVENGADLPVIARFHASTSATRTDGAGYLHAEYRRSGPEGAQPHLVARINGRGKFLGCFLGVTGLDQSWWILEGDERMWVDANPQPVWMGTGLEDYFNGGWYYRGSVFGTLNANYDRSPFRVAQFRHQHPDPVSFNSFFQMEFERMPDQQSGLPVKGWFESVAYYYLDRPSAVQPVPANRDERRAVDNPLDRPTFMLQLVELERANDFRGAMHYVEEYLERYADAEESGVYALRHLEYRRFLGEPVGDEDYQPFLSGDRGDVARQQAELLIWFHAEKMRALVGLNVNGKGRLSLNGQHLLAGDHPYNLFVAGIELSNGTQRLAAQVDFQRTDPWLQVGVRTHDGVAGTGPGTWCAREVSAGWSNAEPAPANWQAIGLRNVPRGVPDAPYIGGIPNAFILLQSKSYPVSGLDWGYYRGTYFFRQDFEMPLKGWPEFSRIMTGLDK